MAADPRRNMRGVNGPRPGRTHGRLRNTITNIASKQDAYPKHVRPTPRVKLQDIRTPGQNREPSLLTSDFLVPQRKSGASDPDLSILKSLQTATRGSLGVQQMLSQQIQNLRQLSQTQAQALRKALRASQRRPNGRRGNFRGPLPKGGTPKQNMAIGKAVAARRFGWAGKEWKALKELWMRESGWRHDAANPTSSARGIPQAMMSIHFGNRWETSPSAAHFLAKPKRQILWGLEYIRERYGTPSKALAFHDANNWY